MRPAGRAMIPMLRDDFAPAKSRTRPPPPREIGGSAPRVRMQRSRRCSPREARVVSSQDEMLVARDGPVVTLTFNRPEARNALTWGMYDRLYETCEMVDGDDSVRVLVLKGAGGKAFVAGTDISQFTGFDRAEDGVAYERDLDRRVGRLASVRKPVIAQIEGFAVGAGFLLATASDLRIATP